MDRDAPLIFLIAGEPSGDLIASRLMDALRQRTGDKVRFAGIGGPLMAEQGLESLFPYAELSMVGFLEIVPHVPRMLRRIRATARTARRLQPAAFVSVDVPEFALRVARRLTGAGFPLIHYVAPTVWAYRPGTRGGDRALSRPRALPVPVRAALFRRGGPGRKLRRPSPRRRAHRERRRAGVIAYATASRPASRCSPYYRAAASAS